MKIFFRVLCAFIFTTMLLSSCSVTRHLNEGEKLVNKVKIRDAPKDKKVALYELTEQKPNQKIFGVYYFHLRMYYLSKKIAKWRGKDKSSDFWEGPTIYSDLATQKTCDNMSAYLRNQGYFNANATSKVKRSGRKKVKVVYKIKAEKPYIINQYTRYSIEDIRIYNIVEAGHGQSLIHIGDPINSETISLERDRITEMLKDHGYFGFSKEYIYFDVDSSLNKHQVNINMGIANPEIYQTHPWYHIGKIWVDPTFAYSDSVRKDTTLWAEDYHFIGEAENSIKVLIYSYTFMKSGDLYSISNMQTTLKKFRDIQQFKYIDVTFTTRAENPDSLLLDVYLKMTPYDRYQFQAQTELNTSEEKDGRPSTPSRLYGMAGSLTFRDLNFAGKSIQMESQLRLSAEMNYADKAFRLYNYELLASNSYNFPRPFLRNLIPNKYELNISSSSVGGSWLWERNSDFRRTTGSVNFGYIYQKGKFKHVFTPIEFSFVGATIISDTFKTLLNESSNIYLKNLFKDHTISSTRWAMYFNNKNSGGKNYFDIQINVFELAGNSFSALAKVIGNQSEGDFTETYKKKLLGMYFFQYLKGDYDIRYHQKTFFGNEMVYRAFFGFIIPYGNSPKDVPFEKRYYIGGSNSIRGWNVRQLGPATYSSPTSGDLVFLQSGDIKMEGNVEYRFKASQTLELAFFCDMGNIWNHKNNRIADEVDNSAFSYKTFYKQFAVAGGIGTRFDFTYFIFRLDFGIPMRDPSVDASDGNSKWFPDKYYGKQPVYDKDNNIIGNKVQVSNILHINFGIGYPF